MNVNVPPALFSMAPILSEFFEAMLHKLNVNSHKDAIRSDDIDGLLAKMEDEIKEFRDQRIQDATDPNILEELSDVANFAFLLFLYLRSNGVQSVKERFINEYFTIDPEAGKIFCKKTRSGTPLKIGDEVVGQQRNGRTFIRAQHSGSGATISIARADLVYWAHTGKWADNPIRYVNGDISDDRISNLDLVDNTIPDTLYPFVSQYRPKGREKNVNFGKWVYQRRHAFKLVRVGYWDSQEEAAREGVIAWKEKIKGADK